MYSSKDFERFFIRYKGEAYPRGESIQLFCHRNKVPYSLFEKWYKNTSLRKGQVLILAQIPRPALQIRSLQVCIVHVQKKYKLFAYLQDGMPIDNKLAERTIRKLTILRNNILHYGSDKGAKMAVIYHSMISTIKLYGGSI